MDILDIITIIVAIIDILLLAPIAYFLLTVWMQRTTLGKVVALSVKHPPLARELGKTYITVRLLRLRAGQ